MHFGKLTLLLVIVIVITSDVNARSRQRGRNPRRNRGKKLLPTWERKENQPSEKIVNPDTVRSGWGEWTTPEEPCTGCNRYDHYGKKKERRKCLHCNPPTGKETHEQYENQIAAMEEHYQLYGNAGHPGIGVSVDNEFDCWSRYSPGPVCPGPSEKKEKTCSGCSKELNIGQWQEWVPMKSCPPTDFWGECGHGPAKKKSVRRCRSVTDKGDKFLHCNGSQSLVQEKLEGCKCVIIKPATPSSPDQPIPPTPKPTEVIIRDFRKEVVTMVTARGPAAWGKWVEGTCSGTCGGGLGTTKRTRKCDSPPPSRPGEKCVGRSSKRGACYNKAECTTTPKPTTTTTVEYYYYGEEFHED